MPCDQIILNRVDLALADRATLLEALKVFSSPVTVVENGERIGFLHKGRRYEIANGQLTSQYRDVGEVADLVKQAYSTQVLKKAASKFGWAMKKTTADNKYSLSRRA